MEDSTDPTEVDSKVLDVLEQEGLRMQAFSLETVTLVQERAYRLLSLLLGGGGGLGALALSEAVGSSAVVGALVASSLWLFALAAWVAWRCLLSREMPGVAGDPVAWLKLHEQLKAYRQELLDEGKHAPSLAELLQRQRLNAISERSLKYRNLSAPRWQALDAAYRMAVFTPLFGLLGAALQQIVC